MKITLTYYGETWVNLWSGTLNVFHDVMTKLIGEQNLKMVSIRPDFSVLYQKSLVLYSRLFFTGNGICKERPIYKRVVKTALKALTNDDSDWVLMIAEHCLTSSFPKNKKYACYIDSDFISVAKYSCEARRIGYDFYVNNYKRYSVSSYANMDVVFTQNEWTRQSIIRDFNFNPDKIFNVRFGVNIESYYGPKDYGNHLMLIVLRESNAKVKGLDLVIKALELIRKKIPDARLAVVGNSQYKGTNGVDTYVGYPRTKTCELFQKASLYVMPSRNEPNGITYLEALCNKVPFVALNRFSTPEFSNNGEWSFLCEKEDPMEIAETVIRAFSNLKGLETMGLKGQKFVNDNYNWECTIKKMISIMEGKK